MICYNVTNGTESWSVEEGRNAESELYDILLELTGDHQRAAEMSSWAMDAPIDRVWEDDDVTLSINDEWRE